MLNFDRPDQKTDDVAAATSYAMDRVRDSDPDFADRIEGAWRAMQTIQAGKNTKPITIKRKKS